MEVDLWHHAAKYVSFKVLNQLTDIHEISYARFVIGSDTNFGIYYIREVERKLETYETAAILNAFC
jgi:hypothetical protein